MIPLPVDRSVLVWRWCSCAKVSHRQPPKRKLKPGEIDHDPCTLSKAASDCPPSHRLSPESSSLLFNVLHLRSPLKIQDHQTKVCGGEEPLTLKTPGAPANIWLCARLSTREGRRSGWMGGWSHIQGNLGKKAAGVHQSPETGLELHLPAGPGP